MTVQANPDRIPVSREFRATLHLSRSEGSHLAALDVSLPGVGAALLNISLGGCCVRLPRYDLPFRLDPGSHISSLRLLHPQLESSPIQGRIVWSTEVPPNILIGIQFMQIRPSTLESIRLLVEDCKTVTA